MPTILSQKIKENREAVKKELSDIMTWIKVQPHEDYTDAILNLFEKTSSTIDILDTIEKWCEGVREEKPHVLPPDNEDYMYSLAQLNRVAGKNSAFTLVQDFIKQTKKEIQ